MKPTPFKFGEVVTGKHFTNRDDEIRRLNANFESLQNTVIISPRRYGKSSLVKEAASRFHENRQQYLFVFIDLMYIYNEEEFYNRFATEVFAAAAGRLEEFLHQAKEMISGARIGISPGAAEPGFEFGMQFIRSNRDKILNLPQLIALKKRKKIIVCIDEFQNISRLSENGNLEARLRSVWQQHDKVGYVLYGSKQTMMTKIFSRNNSPFYRFGDLLYLGRIATDNLRDYLRASFIEGGKEISDELCDRIIHTVENHPYYLQQYARNIWLVSGRKVKEADIDAAEASLKFENQNFYTEVLDELTSYQVGFLKALLNNEQQLYSMDTIYRYQLGSSANVRIMYQAFQQKGIIVKEDDRIVFTDPVFKLIAREKLITRGTGN